LTAASRRASRIKTVADAQAIARGRLPAPVFDYIDGGAGAEVTMAANRAAFEAVTFRPRFGETVGTEPRELATTVLGQTLAVPFLLGPVGFTRSMHPDGDAGGLAAAQRAGTVFCHSSMSGQSIEDLAHPASEQYWFQLYFLGGRQGAEQLVARASDAGCTTLVLTIDTPVPGNRERDLAYSAALPIRVNRRTVKEMARYVVGHPRWLVDAARDHFTLHLANAVGLTRDGRALSEDECLLYWIVEPPTWADLAWIRAAWRGNLLIKGVLHGEDARRALDLGADGVIVSNHGGRQLDPCVSSLAALADVIDAVGPSATVLVDGGVRRGSDVVAALCLGARAVLIGRAWAFGLGAAGEAGVTQVLNALRSDVVRTMQLLGARSVSELTGKWLEPGR
jgi:isopentenyl diphosphate isomerase/L-lactate dehydrogenase-like FMN-dependent dehydrogenase